MLSQLFKLNINKIGFEDMKTGIDTTSNKKTLIINTLSSTEQGCLIKGTTPIEREESLINDLLDKCEYKTTIIVYGKNGCDETAEKKYQQLVKLGFFNVSIYVGGLFEWLLLQDIYGKTEFPTTSQELDILKYKPRRKLE
jgi:hypothetical protein